MGRNTQNGDASLAALEGTQIVPLSFREMQQMENHCNILKDFVFTPLINGRRLHKNSKVLAAQQQEVAEEGQRIEERRGKLHGFLNDPNSTPELKAETEELMKALIAETKEFNVKKYDVPLHTLSIADYPTDPEKFGKKEIPMQDGTKVEVAYYPSFLELTDVIILDDE
jgi:hypothetical protein